MLWLALEASYFFKVPAKLIKCQGWHMVTERILATTPRFVCPRMDYLARIAMSELSILGRVKTRPFF